MAKQVFFGSPLSNQYIWIDDGIPGNTGDQNSVNPPGVNIAGAGGYDDCSGPQFGGCIGQGQILAVNATGSIPDFVEDQTSILNNPASATIGYQNPS
jgi:hypothetical protein